MRLLAVLLVLLVTAGCDQATKHLARSQLSQVSSATLPGGFVELTLTQNPGAFLSLAAWRALASWSAAVLCRFSSRRTLASEQLRLFEPPSFILFGCGFAALRFFAPLR